MPTMPRQPPPARRSRTAGIRRPSPTPRPGEFVDDEIAPPDTAPESPEPETAEPETAEVEASRKPSPRPKRRDRGAVKPADYQPAVSAVVAKPIDAEATLSAVKPADEPRPAARARNKTWLVTGLLGVAVVFVGLAVWFKLEDNQLSAQAANTALLDVARTSQVNQAATGAVETLFSYDFNNIAKTQDAAKDLLLNDDVRNKYDSLMGEVERLAPEQKMVVTVKASRSAVISIEGDRARVMVFVDQTATRTDQNQTSSGSAQLWVNLQFSDGKWKLTGLDTYKAPQPDSAPPAPGK